MKSILIHLTDKEHEKLFKAKEKYSPGCNWHKFILTLTKGVSVFHTKKNRVQKEDLK